MGANPFRVHPFSEGTCGEKKTESHKTWPLYKTYQVEQVHFNPGHAKLIKMPHPLPIFNQPDYLI